MSPRPDTKQRRCARCGRGFTSQGRLGHHWAAEHAPRTSADILRTSLAMARTRHVMPRVPQVFPGAKIRTSAATAQRTARV